MKTIPLAAAKAALSGLVDEVARRDERITITKRGRPAAVLMSHDEAAGLDATLEIMSDPEFYAQILRNRRALDARRGRTYTLDELFGPEEVRSRRAGASSRPAARGRKRPAKPSARREAKGPRRAR
ncbi:MAG TPA: type II toxin-antitoxin system Phd/YefM family antitoxin [Candidatus Limnocylindrales bacterium]|nr:type II toxin-antitoxin system Phd/YefM family antitoxin [Candidatus Limnocylindrales bacterium]